MTMNLPRSATTIANTIPSYPTSSHYLVSQLRTRRDKAAELAQACTSKKEKSCRKGRINVKAKGNTA